MHYKMDIKTKMRSQGSLELAQETRKKERMTNGHCFGSGMYNGVDE